MPNAYNHNILYSEEKESVHAVMGYLKYFFSPPLLSFVEKSNATEDRCFIPASKNKMSSNNDQNI